MRLVYALLLVVATLVASCSSEPELQLTPNEPLELVAGTVVRTLRPEEDVHRRLQAWLKSTPSKWSPYYGTHPSGPQFIVRAGAQQLYVYSNDALLRTRSGMYSRSLAPNELAFLAPTKSP
jgi:hypothetical protein